MGEEKKIFSRYGVCWHKKGEHYEALCPACEKALNSAGSTDFFCNECKKVISLYIGDGIPITIDKAVELLMKAEKTDKGVSGRTYGPGFWADQYDGECEQRKTEKAETEEETRAIGNGIIICKLNDVLTEVDAFHDRLEAFSTDIKESQNYIVTEIWGARGDITSRIISQLYYDKRILNETKKKDVLGGIVVVVVSAMIGSVVTLVVQSFLN